MVRIGQAQSRTPAAIERELARIERESAQLAQELRTQGQNLYQQLASVVSSEQLNAEQGAGEADRDPGQRRFPP